MLPTDAEIHAVLDALHATLVPEQVRTSDEEWDTRAATAVITALNALRATDVAKVILTHLRNQQSLDDEVMKVCAASLKREYETRYQIEALHAERDKLSNALRDLIQATDDASMFGLPGTTGENWRPDLREAAARARAAAGFEAPAAPAMPVSAAYTELRMAATAGITALNALRATDVAKVAGLTTHIDLQRHIDFQRHIDTVTDLVNGVPRFAPVLASVSETAPVSLGGDGVALHVADAPESETCENPTVVEALLAAEAALVDLGACADARCTLPQCTHALVKVRSVLMGYPPHAATEERKGKTCAGVQALIDHHRAPAPA